MLTRFLSVSLLALSSSLWGVACNRPSETGESGASSQSSVVLPIPDPVRQWDGLLEGHPSLPSSVVSALRRGAGEEALALSPRVPLEEGVPATQSRARHQRLAIGHYEEALNLLGDAGDENREVRRRIRGKIESLRLSVDSLEAFNGRVFPGH